MKFARAFCLSLLMLLPTAAHAVVVMIYHRFGDDRFPSTNIRLDQFEAQIAHLTAGDHKFMTASQLIAAYRAGRDVSDRTVVFTIDDAFRSVLEEAAPRLKAAGIPWTLFVSTDPVDQGIEDYMAWSEIRALRADGVDIGHHTASHLHMIEAGAAQSKEDIEQASKRFQTELGEVPEIFAYPYGEYSLELRRLVERAGFRGAFAQYSGASDPAADPYQIPRFPMAERYADLERFQLIVDTKPLPVREITPADPLIAGENPPLYGFSVPGFKGDLARLNCYPSHTGERVDSTVLADTRVEVRLDKPFPRGRHRINCTMPAGEGRWYWYGRPFFNLR